MKWNQPEKISRKYLLCKLAIFRKFSIETNTICKDENQVVLKFGDGCIVINSFFLNGSKVHWLRHDFHILVFDLWHCLNHRKLKYFVFVHGSLQNYIKWELSTRDSNKENVSK